MRAGRSPWLAGYFMVLTIALLMPADRQWHAHRAPIWLSLGTDLTPMAIARDAVVNATIFLPLGTLLYLHFSRGRRRWGAALAATTLVAAAFSTTMETGQYLLAWRESSLLDVISDTIGAIIGAGIAVVVTRLPRPAEALSADLEKESARRAA